MPDALLTASRPELLDSDGDRTLRGLLYDFFAFGRSLEAARARFAGYVGLTHTQYLIMVAIKNSTLDEPMGINQLAAQLRLSGAFITNEVNKLAADGLIEKGAHPRDRRRVQLRATDKGFDLLAQLLARLAADGDRAVAFADYVEASIGQGPR